MLSELLTSKYLQYKSDTDMVASWLANTASHCGLKQEPCPTAGPSEESQPPPSRRLKGKARKEAQKSQASSAEREAKRIKQNYKITVRDFTRFSEYIAGHTPIVRVPSIVVNALERAIASRRQFNRSGLFAQSPNETDDGHAHFIGVLEHVRGILKPLVSTTEETKVRSSTCPGDTRDEASINMFDGLEVEQPSDAFLNAPDPPQTDPIPHIECETASISDPTEALFRFSLLLDDANAFLTFVRDTWKGYRDGILDLVTTAITTNTTIDLLRRMEAELEPMLNQHPSLEKPIEVLYLARCNAIGLDGRYRERPGDLFNIHAYDATEDLFMTAFEILERVPYLEDGRGSAIYKSDPLNKYSPQSDRTRKSAREKLAEDDEIVQEILPELCILCFIKTPNPALDEFTRGMQSAFVESKRPFWLVYSAQVYLEIHHVLRGNVGQGFVDLQQSARYMVNSINITLEFQRGSNTVNWTPELEEFLSTIKDEMKIWCQNDALEEPTLGKRYQRMPFHLMRRHPLFCGLLQYRFKSFFHELGITFAGSWGSVLYTLHLYNALRQEKVLQSSWRDMEVVHGMQSQCWVGGPPQNPEDYLRRFALSMGLSVTSFAKNRRLQRHRFAKGGPRGMAVQAPVAQMFSVRFCEGSRQWDLTEEDLRKIVARAERSLTAAGEAPVEGQTDARSTIPAEDPHITPGAGGSLSALELLYKLRCALHGEAPELNWDYFLMHRLCWRLLRSVKVACEDRLRTIRDIACLEQESELAFIVGFIFQDWDKVNAVNGTDNGRAERNPSQSMLSAAKVFQAMLDSGAGSIATRQLMENQGVLLERQPDTEDEAETVGTPDHEERVDSSFETTSPGSKADEVGEEKGPRVSWSLWSTWGVQFAGAWRTLRYLLGTKQI